jgi:hypothetical protein
MPTAEARIETARASRYLVQFCQHAAAMGGAHGHRPQMHDGDRERVRREIQVKADWSETEGIVHFTPWGRCTLKAMETALELRVDATDDEKLMHIQEIITADMLRFGRRDQLTVSWRRIDTPNTLSDT